MARSAASVGDDLDPDAGGTVGERDVERGQPVTPGGGVDGDPRVACVRGNDQQVGANAGEQPIELRRLADDLHSVPLDPRARHQAGQGLGEDTGLGPPDLGQRDHQAPADQVLDREVVVVDTDHSHAESGESGAEIVWHIARWNPFTHAVELIRYALYGRFEPLACTVVLGSAALFFIAATLGYDPQRGLLKRSGRPG